MIETKVIAKKRLLIYAHYYVPDVASTGQILKELAEGMLDKFDITVICVVPSYSGKVNSDYKTKLFYNEKINGIKIIRIRVPEFSKSSKFSRINNLLTYFFGAMVATIKVGKMDYVYSISQPPILGGLIGVWGKWVKKAKFIYNIQDFNPEQTIAIGYSKNKLILNTMMWIDKFSCKSADKVIIVGRDMIETLKERFKDKKTPSNVFINNWIDEKEIYPLPADNGRVEEFKKKYGLESKFIIMYSGNLGLYYDLEKLMSVIEKFKENGAVAFVFVGDGSIREKLISYKNRVGLENAVFIPYQNKTDMIYSLNAADCHWCVSAKGIKGVSVPSKLYGIMSVGKPVLGVLEKGSEARLIIEETKCGLVSEPGDYRAVEHNINWFINKSSYKELKEMGNRGREYLLKNLTKDVSVAKYKKEIESC